jgi:hypothetical protein
MPDQRLSRTRTACHPCAIGDAPHRFFDTVNGQVLGHAFRDGIVVVTRCQWCGLVKDREQASTTP